MSKIAEVKGLVETGKSKKVAAAVQDDRFHGCGW